MSDTEILVKPNLEAVRRLEVFTGAGRRRSWTAEQKAQIVAETYQSGETVSAVARRHALTPQQLFGWRRDARQQREDGACDGVSAFAPVLVEAVSSSADAAIAPVCPRRSTAIEIVIGAATVRIKPGTDGATLQTVLRALLAAT
jgi:transposase